MSSHPPGWHCSAPGRSNFPHQQRENSMTGFLSFLGHCRKDALQSHFTQRSAKLRRVRWLGAGKEAAGPHISPAVGATMSPGPCSTRSPAACTMEETSAQHGHFQLPTDFSTEVCPSLVFTLMVINCPSFSLLPPHHTHSLGPLPVASPSLCGCASAGYQPVHVHAVSPITSLHCRVCI